MDLPADMESVVAAFTRKNPRDASLIKAIANGFAPSVREFIVAAVEPVRSENARLSAELVGLRDRVKELESRPSLKYAGIWKSDAVYGSGTFITDGGSVWHAQRASVGERPGSGDAWQLAVKKGRDAR
jgi:hypothetical protein